MDANVVILERCKALSRAAMARAADGAEPGAAAASDDERLGAFTPKARVRILDVLNRLPDSARR